MSSVEAGPRIPPARLWWRREKLGWQWISRCAKVCGDCLAAVRSPNSWRPDVVSRIAWHARGFRCAKSSTGLIDIALPLASHQPPSDKAIEIAWPNGIALRVAPGCDCETLREAFGLLSSAMNGEIWSC